MIQKNQVYYISIITFDKTQSFINYQKSLLSNDTFYNFMHKTNKSKKTIFFRSLNSIEDNNILAMLLLTIIEQPSSEFLSSLINIPHISISEMYIHLSQRKQSLSENIKYYIIGYLLDLQMISETTNHSQNSLNGFQRVISQLNMRYHRQKMAYDKLSTKRLNEFFIALDTTEKGYISLKMIKRFINRYLLLDQYRMKINKSQKYNNTLFKKDIWKELINKHLCYNLHSQSTRQKQKISEQINQKIYFENFIQLFDRIENSIEYQNYSKRGVTYKYIQKIIANDKISAQHKFLQKNRRKNRQLGINETLKTYIEIKQKAIKIVKYNNCKTQQFELNTQKKTKLEHSFEKETIMMTNVAIEKTKSSTGRLVHENDGIIEWNSSKNKIKETQKVKKQEQIEKQFNKIDNENQQKDSRQQGEEKQVKQTVVKLSRQKNCYDTNVSKFQVKKQNLQGIFNQIDYQKHLIELTAINKAHVAQCQKFQKLKQLQHLKQQVIHKSEIAMTWNTNTLNVSDKQRINNEELQSSLKNMQLQSPSFRSFGKIIHNNSNFSKNQELNYILKQINLLKSKNRLNMYLYT